MAHVEDRWWSHGPTGRVRTERHGQGKRWRAVWTEPGGKRRRESFTTKDAATAKLARVHSEIQGGAYIRPTTVTVAEFGDRWVTMQLHHRRRTSEGVESKWRVHIRPALGGYAVRDVTRDVIQGAVAEWARTLAPATVRGVYAYTSAMFRAAVGDLIRDTPCSGIRLPPLVKTRVIPLTVQQVHGIADRQRPRYRAMVWLAAATGVRHGELRGITVDRLRFHPGGVVVSIDRQLDTTAPTWGPTKTPTSVRDIPCDRETADMLTRHLLEFPPHPTGLIFTNQAGNPISASGVAKLWHIGTVGMALPDRSGWHLLRHFHASVLIAGGLSPVAVAARLGHKDTAETLRTYAHLWHDDDDRAQAAVAEILWPPHSPRLRVIAGQGHVG